METFTSVFNILSAIVSIIWFVAGLVFLFSKKESAISKFVSKNILWLGVFVAGSSLVGSLIYSNVIGYAACTLCWYARILLYPQFAIFLLALMKKDRGIFDYVFLLSILGIIISGYHYFLVDLAHIELVTCDANNVSCATRYVYEFGFVTIPFMSLSAFVFLTGALASAKRALKQSIN